MNITPDEIENYLSLLAATSRRLINATQAFDDVRLQYKSDEKVWSANEILAHLRSCADVWGSSIEAMLEEDNPTLPYRHPRQWIKKTNYPDLLFHESFKAFQMQRKKLLKILKSLSFEDWSRAAMIKNREHTVFTQTRRMALHEDIHCQQIEELLESIII
jgi:hypothetical protein